MDSLFSFILRLNGIESFHVLIFISNLKRGKLDSTAQSEISLCLLEICVGYGSFACDAMRVLHRLNSTTLMDCFEKVAQNGLRLNLILLSQKHGSNFSHFKFVNY